MFKLNDFLKLMLYYKDGTTTGLDPNIIPIAENSKAKTTTLFNDNLDLACHISDDYKRLKEFLITWYSSFSTFNNIMKDSSDVRSLPEEFLNELINSFGYTEELDKLTRSSKVNFFYDLVNLYKVKGTPEAIGDVLNYFQVTNSELVEYWLQYDQSGELVLHPEKILSSSFNYTSSDLDFSYTETDPHWMLTRDQINKLFLNNRIAFPSKTPYFGIRPVVYLSGGDIESMIAILSRLVQNQYAEYKSGTTPTADISLSKLNVSASLLDLYMAVIYVFNKLHTKIDITNPDPSFLCYNGSMTLTNPEIIDLYQDITSRLNLNTREEIKNNREIFYNKFTRLRTTNFLVNESTSETVLQSTNPALKTLIDQYFNFSVDGGDIENILLNDLSSWIIDNIDPNASFFSNSILGLDSLDYIKNVINFFKPYRARLILVEGIYVIKNPLFDSLIADDVLNQEFTETFVDFDTADSEPGYAEDFIPTGTQIYSTPPTDQEKRIEEIYMDSAGVAKTIYTDSTADIGIPSIVYSNPPIGGYRVYNLYLEDILGGGKKLYIEYNEDPETVGGIKTKIVSNPLQGFYQINDVYMNHLLQFEIVYDGDPIIWPIDSTSRVYYSRITYDCGSYFDIGASCDFPPKEHDQIITHDIYDIYNYHTEDSTAQVSYEYTGDTTGVDYFALQDGGWVDFDGGGIIDAPQIADICEIYVTDIP